MKRLIKIVVALGALVGFVYINQQWLQITKYSIVVKKLPKKMEGLRIVQISDLHHAQFGDNQEELIQKVSEQKPDLILITGDLVDRYNYDLERSLNAVKGFVKIAPVYYVIGNHEVSINDVEHIKTRMTELGVHVLSNHAEDFTMNGATIQLVGIDDPLNGKTTDEMLDLALKNVDTFKFQILLAHRPEYYKNYEQHGVDLTFNGHAHGGQIRIPGLGGLVDHQFNLFPAHIDGVEQINGMTQIISRGLGNSRGMIRVNNRPEIVVADLHTK
ncbi:metallophosphoesterase [Rummeliibacillus pycnus]|uniref:metallophosphoesterase n=1 Tax=Rummeliibacillus pycnus TaxID=101070 RepID=UPI003D2D5E37